MAVPVWYVRSHKGITGRWIVGPWPTTSTSRSGHTPAGRQSAIPKRSCVEIVILNAMCLWSCWSMVGGVPWPEMAASPGSVGSWRPVIWCLFPVRGHHTDCAARSLHFATPVWPSGILSRICFLKQKGTTILSPLTESPSWRLSSPLTMKKSLAANWTSFLYWGQPWIVVYSMAASVEVHIFQSLCSDLGQSCVWHWL